ncbi:hypothetical protein RND81_01G099800 [Saponaria officinalis]|uniref:Endonuclease/exonuclease/phosphatase domain-containing protein n=1 Tax=Saponaria officinalis TaxID=3572 RepID=A0AAW1N6T1_SAPOF
MNLLSYNCQGLGNDPAVVKLKKLLRREDAEVVVLQETKLSGREMEAVTGRLDGYEGLYGDSIGKKAGVAILWRSDLSVALVSSSAHHIDVEIEGLFSCNKWRLTGFYGWADNERKHLSWELLREIRGFSNLPWMVIGDFNQILFEGEKKGGAPRAQSEMNDFRKTMDDCNPTDLGYIGNPFTWWNKRGEPDDIVERLDRAIVSPEWVELFPSFMLHHLARDSSDHIPIKVMRQHNGTRGKKRQYKFEDMWTSSETCEGVIRDAWGNDGSTVMGLTVISKIEKCARDLMAWSRTEFGDIGRRLCEARKRMMFLDKCNPTAEMVQERRRLCAEVDSLVAQEETY